MSRQAADSTDSPGPPSKAAALRLLVSQRLAAASREILAAVDSTVAGYEEEASGFRRELERQRRQLEALLQPRAAGVNRSRSLRPAEEEEGENKDGDRSSSRRQFEENQISETRNHVNLRIRILEDPHTKVLSKHVLRKCPMLKLRCPRALQEADFLEWLRSISPRLAGDKPFDILTSNKRRRLKRLRLKTLTLEEICRHVGCAGWETSTLFIRPKEQKQPEAGEEEIHCLQTRGSSSEDSSSAAGATLTFETSIPGQEVEGGRMDDLSLCSTSQQDAVTEEAEDNCWIMKPDEKCAATSKSDDDNKEEERQRANESDGYWKPDKCDEELKGSDSELTKNQNARCSEAEAKTENNDAAFSCKVCGALYQSEVTLVKHVWTHMDSSESLCGVCGERPESLEALKDHLQSRHRTEDCHVCGESFLGALSLSEHVAAHSGERPHRCHVCCASFALMSSLENHQKLHKEDELYKCYTCHKVFELKEQLKAHRRTHNKKGAHLCGVCGKSLSDYRSLSRHKMIHSGERPHSCQVCGRSFKLPGTLRQHEKIHTDRERSYLCDVCCKMFLTSKQLQIHMRTHTNEKPYHCGECGKGFTTKGPLTIHMRVHTGETPYRCPDCGWSFKRKINLDNHVTVHSGAKPFVCGICGKACARKTYLTVHMRTHNGERPYKCTLCDKAFTQSHCLKTHMKSHMAAENNT